MTWVPGSFVWQEWRMFSISVNHGQRSLTNIPSYPVDVASSIQPYPLPNHLPAKGVPGLDKSYNIQYNTEKEKGILGIKFKTLEETTRDTLEDFAARGW